MMDIPSGYLTVGHGKLAGPPSASQSARHVGLANWIIQ